MTINKYLYIILLFLCTITMSAQEERSDTICSEQEMADSIAIDSIPALPWPQSLQANIDTIISKSSFLNTSQMGLLIYDITADSVLYARDERQTLRPASTMKLLTAITALDKLGGAYTYKTRLCYTGEVVDSTSVLNGDIYIIGGMDPKLGHDDLRAFALSIKELGVDTIRGHVYADRSMKDEHLYGEGWCWDDDNPELSPLVYGRKDNMMKYFLQAIADAGIYLDGTEGVKTCPNGAEELCRRTHTIEQILQRMMKDSNNLYAETMLYQIGLSQGKPATAKKAQAVEKALIRKIGMQDRPYRLADGSGLSLYNYVSAEIEVAFLRYAQKNSNIYEYLYPSLPIAGVDGTLEKRMVKTPAANNVHAKTGTLSGISSLAGYCTAANGHELCFAIINQGVMKGAIAKAFQDKICIAMCRE
ncbi:MAG: D-alanyl-D-alanine carboxypeptidase/D-alanyl-D-alanine-endopeptidase [Prevotella sp.]|nr:D-alanyl-D-alanine carboxypeptidase/D-alanyl-D-alanine-endopeptidase [Candidatus Prevotella equi]